MHLICLRNWHWVTKALHYEPGNFEKSESQKKRNEKTNSSDKQNHQGSLTTAKSPTQTRTPRKRKGEEREKGRRKKPSTRDQPGHQPREERETRNPTYLLSPIKQLVHYGIQNEDTNLHCWKRCISGKDQSSWLPGVLSSGENRPRCGLTSSDRPSGISVNVVVALRMRWTSWCALLIQSTPDKVLDGVRMKNCSDLFATQQPPFVDRPFAL